jgi:hypothetical protein
MASCCRHVHGIGLALLIAAAVVALEVSPLATPAQGARGQAAGDGGQRGHWHPRPTTKPWQWQLQGTLDTSIDVPVFDVDGFETPRRAVSELHRLRSRVICYLDVGSWESFRPDANRFPRSVLGKRYEGFPNERWLDIRHFSDFARQLERRFAMCERKGSTRSSRTIWPAGKTEPALRSAAPPGFASTAGLPPRSTDAGWRWP